MAHGREMAESALAHKPGGDGPKAGSKPAFKPLKEFHVKELHDGTYHVMKHHGHDHMGMPVREAEEGSAQNVDEVHAHLHDHLAAGFHDGEAGGEKKQGSSEPAKHEKEKPHSEEDEKSGDGETVEK